MSLYGWSLGNHLFSLTGKLSEFFVLNKMGTLRILRKLVGFSFSTAVYETIARNKLVVFLLMESEKVCLAKFSVTV